MAVSRDSLNGPDLMDVITALNSFEQINKVRVIVSIRSCGEPESPGIWWEAKAVELEPTRGVRKLLASVQLSCAALNIKTMSAAMFNLIYQLDYELAEREFRDTPHNKA